MKCSLPLFLAAFCITVVNGQTLDKLELRGTKAVSVSFRGKKAIHLTQTAGGQGDSLALVGGAALQDGTLEIELAGAPAQGAGEGARGFIGIAFRSEPDASRYELFYLRPTNGRAADQLRRNHSTQYVSVPDWPWERTRKETPGLYESYADMEPGVWIKVKVEVSGATARLFVNGAEQPCLIVNDLKLSPKKGGIALWIGPGTDGYFANLAVHPR